ncbi:NADH-quinone oxidoreductase subunit J [Anaplasma phagocytophilum]|uniref:NADH-quinone oxidoreductase subunit J n=2 Tax=Anaplasma phagocytophilum TaxID=948 RepID=A0A098EHZ6_ANAPH|nr:NADH-quinone oxidoreductase subunit J [Anaplasma phagocytophilum]CEG20921.1 NADH dehydrogenase I, J subunit [Anaplasma phagocytophilum]
MVGFLFFCFAGMVVFSAVAVVISSNPVYAVLSLILTFFISSVLFILLAAELVAMLLVVVYVGAVAVLFLFVVMMLDMDFVKSSHGFVRYYPICVALATALFGCATYAIFHTKAAFIRDIGEAGASAMGNVFLIGSQMYTKYFYAFQMSGILLLVASIGALVLTVRSKAVKSRKQNVYAQVDRSSKVELCSPAVGKGIEDID